MTGVAVGHLTLAQDEVQTGVTVILPYPLAIRNRKLFLGSFAAKGWQEWTGRHVAQDFGTFSSPIVLCNATAVGTAYDALITFGHQRHPDLPIDNAWPPIVIGLDDGYLNNLRVRRLTSGHVLQTIYAASPAPACGCKPPAIFCAISPAGRRRRWRRRSSRR
ncbi:MAG: P1 family peptidase, partial [candidate division KSB1 bacterium]|nr:P1 family peptidase [candidate division KSB1 bacterium]